MSLEFWNGDVVVFVWIQFIFMDSIEAQTQMLFINRFCHHVKIIMFRRRSMLKKKSAMTVYVPVSHLEVE